MDLFDWAEGGAPRARNSDPPTSRAAAQRVREFAGDHCALILAALKDRAGTIYDIARWSGLSHVQVARRMPELQAAGRVEAGRSAPGPSGRDCRVWRRLMPEGAKAFRPAPLRRRGRWRGWGAR